MKLSKETTKNVLRGRKCETCGRRLRDYPESRRCQLNDYTPAEGVCSQWMLSPTEKVIKEIRHNKQVREKRRERKERNREKKNSQSQTKN